jgi:hypothetical protein
VSKRHETIGIKQAIRIEWLDKAVNLLLSGLNAKSIRAELHEYLSERKGDGSTGNRSENTRSFAVNNLMNIWVTPAKEILPLRDDALKLIKEKPDLAHTMHWAMLCAVYPFWYNTAVQVGRLLNLQDQITQKQIISRLKEQYGDRDTIGRYAKYVIRAFVYWNVLKESDDKGCYTQGNINKTMDEEVIALMFEAVLLAQEDGKSTINDVTNSPGLFPFTCISLTSSQLVSLNPRLSVSLFSIGDEYIFLNR